MLIFMKQKCVVCLLFLVLTTEYLSHEDGQIFFCLLLMKLNEIPRNVCFINSNDKRKISIPFSYTYINCKHMTCNYLIKCVARNTFIYNVFFFFWNVPNTHLVISLVPTAHVVICCFFFEFLQYFFYSHAP